MERLNAVRAKTAYHKAARGKREEIPFTFYGCKFNMQHNLINREIYGDFSCPTLEQRREIVVFVQKQWP